MRVRSTRFVLALLFLLCISASSASAQTVGTFRWQLQPWCNVVTLTVTQAGSVYQLDGWDDQCGGDRASVVGTAFLNPDGTIGFGLNIVTTPGGRPVTVDAEITLGTLSGSWRDSTGSTGQFVLTPGAIVPGSPRPAAPSNTTISDRLVVAGTYESGGTPVGGAGTRLEWNARRSAFRAGTVGAPNATAWDDANIGNYSTAFGQNTRASGTWSTAFGFGTTASGPVSTALGQETIASGVYSTAMGYQTQAVGTSSTAMGTATSASGPRSVAMGLGSSASGTSSLAAGTFTVASGVSSVAFGESAVATAPRAFAGGLSANAAGSESFAWGTRAQAGGAGSVVLGSDVVVPAPALGSFAFGDRSTTNDLVATAPNSFVVRAAGGVGFYTNAAMNAGVELAPSGTQWLVVSDVNTKRLFRDLDGEDVLRKLAAMPIQEWSYKHQDAAIRHVGPTAQDFRAAFGLGENPLRIGTLDADGIALAAVKALEARTQALLRENAALREALATIQTQVAALVATPK